MSPPTLVVFTKPAAWLNFRAQKILAVAALANVSLQSRHITLDLENAAPEFMASVSPLGRIPVLQFDDGRNLFESNTIIRWVARTGENFLCGKDVMEQCEVDMWLDFTLTELDPVAVAYSKRVRFGTSIPDDNHSRVCDVLHALERCLLMPSRQADKNSNVAFLVGSRLTAADVALAFGLQRIFRMNPENAQELAERYASVFALYNHVMEQPKVLRVLDDFGSGYGVLLKQPVL